MKQIVAFLILLIVLISSANISAQEVIVLKPGPDKGKDVNIWSIYPENNFSEEKLLSAIVWTWSGLYGVRYFYIDFDMDTLSDPLKLISAKLNFYYHHLGEGSEKEQTQYGENWSVIRRVTSPWEEDEVTWNTKPQTTMDHQVLVSKTLDMRQDVTGIDVTLLVKDMLNTPDSSFGFEFRILEESIYRRMAFASSDHPDSDLWPELVLTMECDSVPTAGFDYIIKDGMYQFTDTSQNAISWYWDFGDGYSSTVRNPKHEYFIEDTVQVCLTVTGNCGTDEYCTVFKSSLTSVNQNVLNSRVAVYPNPASSEVTIEFKGADMNSFGVVIRNALGQLVKEANTTGSVKTFQVNIEDLESGVYFIDIKHGQFHTIKKLIIQ